MNMVTESKYTSPACRAVSYTLVPYASINPSVTGISIVMQRRERAWAAPTK